MDDSNSDECLPPGWTVKVNVRKNGKIDKYYFPPSSDQKFNSMVGVFRYLDNAKKKADDQQIPRRASKRLAGIKADPLPELRTIQACRDVVKQSGEDKTVVNAERSTKSLPNNQEKQFPALDVSETKFNAESTENKMENHATEKECVKILKNEDNVDAKLDYTDEFLLKEILTDPCIAFAMQTLTEETFETSKDTHSELKSKQYCENSAYTKEHSKKIKVAHDDSDGHKVLSTPEHVGVAQIGKVGLSSLNLCKSGYNCSQNCGEEGRNVC